MLGRGLDCDQLLRARALRRSDLRGKLLLQLSMLYIVEVFLAVSELAAVRVDGDTGLSLLWYHLGQV